jgi:hypothetical protein
LEQEWFQDNTSVHLMEAAVDDEQVSMDSKILAMKIDHLYPALEAL